MPVWTCGEIKGEGFLEFTACKLTGQHTEPHQPGAAELPSQGSRFCLLIYPASKKEGSAEWTHKHKHREEPELKPQHKGNKNSKDQRGQGAARERELE